MLRWVKPMLLNPRTPHTGFIAAITLLVPVCHLYPLLGNLSSSAPWPLRRVHDSSHRVPWLQIIFFSETVLVMVSNKDTCIFWKVEFIHTRRIMPPHQILPSYCAFIVSKNAGIKAELHDIISLFCNSSRQYSFHLLAERIQCPRQKLY